MYTPEEKFETNNHLVKQLGNGNAGAVYLFITRDEADGILQGYLSYSSEDGNLPTTKYIEQIRSSLRAVKILGTFPQGVNLDHEVQVLAVTNTLCNPNLVKMLQHHHPADQNYVEWYEMEGFGGGTLQDFTNMLGYWRYMGVTKIVPIAFGWHLVLQMATALLALQFGTSAPMYHGDVAAKNMLLRAPAARSTRYLFPSYPDIVLADMGEARQLTPDAKHDERYYFFKQQHADVHAMLAEVRQIYGNKLGITRISVSLQKLEQANPGYPDENAALKQWFISLIAQAKQERTAAFDSAGEFDRETARYFKREIISSSELLEFWARLQNPPSPHSSDDMRF